MLVESAGERTEKKVGEFSILPQHKPAEQYTLVDVGSLSNWRIPQDTPGL